MGVVIETFSMFAANEEELFSVMIKLKRFKCDYLNNEKEISFEGENEIGNSFCKHKPLTD